MAQALAAFLRTTAIAASGRYFPTSMNGSSGNATESGIIARKAYIAGTLAGMNVHIDAIGTSRVIQSRVNLANGNMVVSPADAASGYFADATHSDHLATTDTFDFTVTYTGSNPFLQFVVMNFTADAGHAALYGSAQLTDGLTGTTFIGAFGSSSNISATETDDKFRVRAAGTFGNYAINVVTVTTSTATIVSRKNGATANISLTVTASTTGLFEDTTHSDAVVSGDDYNMQCSGQSAGFAFYQTATVASSTTQNDICAGAGNTVTFTASGTPSYMPIVALLALSTTESDTSVRHGFDGICSNARIRAITNTLGAAATIKLRKNNADGNQSITLTAATTGLFEDTTNTDAFLPNDDINLSIANGTSGTVGLQLFGLTENSLFLMGQSVM